MNTVPKASSVVRQQRRRPLLLHRQGAESPENDRHSSQRIGAALRDLLLTQRINTVLPVDVHIATEAEHHTIGLREVQL